MQTDLTHIEQAFLGCLIVSDDAFKKSPSLLPAHFILPLHGEIYESIVRRHKNGDAVDARLLALEFDKHICLSTLGGGNYIHDMANSYVSIIAAPDYAKEIYKAHCQRAMEDIAANCDGSTESLAASAKLLAELADDGSNSKSRRLKPYSWQELQSLPKREALIKGILDRHAVSIVYGESNCGKTFFTLDICLHIALGCPWLGRRVQQGKVLYVAAEGGLGLTERLQALWLHHEPKDAFPLYLVPAGIDLCKGNADTQGIIREAHVLGGIEIIVIDTLSRAMAGGNENSPDDMGAFIKNCDLIREQIGAHVLIVHHSGKDTSQGARGHSSLRAAVDTEIEITKDKSGVITAEIRKQRDGKTGDRFSFILESIHLGSDDDGDPVSSCVLIPTDESAIQAPKKKLSPNMNRAFSVLNDLMIERGKKLIPKEGMQKVTVVQTVDFREALKKSNISASDKPDNVRRQIQRIIEDLNNKGITATWENMTWIVGQAGQ